MNNSNLNNVIDQIQEKKVQFLVVFFIIFSLSYLVLLAIDFVPEENTDKEKVEKPLIDPSINLDLSQAAAASEAEAIADTPVYPLSIYIERLDKTVEVLNPSSRSISALDAALLSGVVRHPDSALVGQKGSVFILGHSSYLPQVFNQNFKAFNGIQDLEWGDTIEVTAEDRVHVYRVDKVYKAQATDATVVPIAGDEKRLILATCDSFGTVSDRFIVEATEINVKQLSAR